MVKDRSRTIKCCARKCGARIAGLARMGCVDCCRPTNNFVNCNTLITNHSASKRKWATASKRSAEHTHKIVILLRKVKLDSNSV